MFVGGGVEMVSDGMVYGRSEGGRCDTDEIGYFFYFPLALCFQEWSGVWLCCNCVILFHNECEFAFFIVNLQGGDMLFMSYCLTCLCLISASLSSKSRHPISR